MMTAPNLMQCNDGEPKLNPALENGHNHVASSYAQGLEVGGSLVGMSFDVGEGVGLTGSFVVGPEQGSFCGVGTGPFVYYVVGKIEVFRHNKFVVGHEVFVTAERRLLKVFFNHDGRRILKDDGQETNGFVVKRFHAVLFGRIEV